MTYEDILILAISTAFGLAVATPVYVWSEAYRERVIRQYKEADDVWAMLLEGGDC